MTTTPPASARLVLPTALVAVVALAVALATLLRTPSRSAAAPSADLDALRQEVAELRRSVDLTRSQMSTPGNGGAIADAERRLAQIEARLAATPVSPTRPTAAPSAASPAETPNPGDPQVPTGPLPKGIAFDSEGRLIVPDPKK